MFALQQLFELLRLVQLAIITRTGILTTSNLHQLFIRVQLIKDRVILFSRAKIFLQGHAQLFAYILIMIWHEMILIFNWTAEGILHSIAVWKVKDSVKGQPGCPLTAYLHPKVALVIVEILHFLPKQIRKVPG